MCGLLLKYGFCERWTVHVHSGVTTSLQQRRGPGAREGRGTLCQPQPQPPPVIFFHDSCRVRNTHRRDYGRSTIYFKLFDRWEGALWPCFAAFAGGGQICSYATACPFLQKCLTNMHTQSQNVLHLMAKQANKSDAEIARKPQASLDGVYHRQHWNCL